MCPNLKFLVDKLCGLIDFEGIITSASLQVPHTQGLALGAELSWAGLGKSIDWYCRQHVVSLALAAKKDIVRN